MSDRSLQDAAARPSSSGLHVVGLVLLVGGVVGRFVSAAVLEVSGVVVPAPWSLIAFFGGVMLFVAARRRR